MTRTVAVRLLVVAQPMGRIGHPAHRIVGMQILEGVVVFGQEALGLGPQGRQGRGCVVDVDCEAVRLVMILHVPEDVVVDVAEEMYVGLHPPVVVHILQRRLRREEARVPSAHLMVADLVRILHIVFRKYLGRLFKQIKVDPRRCGPMLFRYLFEDDLSTSLAAHSVLEGFSEGLVVKKGPRIVELGIECAFEVSHRLEHLVELRVADEREEGGADAIGGGIRRCIVAPLYTVQGARRFIDC